MYVEVNGDRLTDCLESWVETFDDCACCPLYSQCLDIEDIHGIDIIDCAEKIKDWMED